MESDNLCYLSLQDLSGQLRTGKLSSVEVTRCILDRIQQMNPRLHAYLTVLDESALYRAAQVDEEIRSGHRRGPLHGVPIAVKDLCQTKGVRTTCASRILRDWRPDSSATVVERLEAAGAVLVGKLNLTEFATFWYHPEMPVPLNPWDAAVWPGASSSGSGVATSAALCFASIGTDTGGSIRFPSAACGIVGLKPTWGRVSRHGIFPLGESLDHIGPMTRSVADAALVLGIIAGRDAADETSLSAPVEDYAAALERGAKATAVLNAVRVLERLGGKVAKVALPDVEPGIVAVGTICGAETAAAHEQTYPAKSSEYGPGFRSFLELGATVRGQDYAKAHIVRERFANRFQELFDQVDVIACPSMTVASLPATGMPADARGLAGSNSLLHFTAPFNLSRNPTLSQPCGQSPIGPPPSLQLIGRHLGEATLIQTGAAFERATEWHKQRPEMRNMLD
jgi:amidase